MLFQYLSGFEPILYTTHTNEEPLFLATELPFVQAMRKCKKIEDCLSGGVYAEGGHIVIRKDSQSRWEQVLALDELFFHEQKAQLEQRYPLKVRNYQKGNIIYRTTLFSKRKTGFTAEELNRLQREITDIADRKGISYMLHMEKGHLGITGENADKKNGVLAICREEGIALTDGAAVGDASEDFHMLELFPISKRII